MVKYKLKEFTCRICGKKFKARFSHNMTCSIKCKSRARKLDSYPPTGIRKCDYCGKEYYYIHGMPNWNKNGAYNKRGSFESSKYCCYECGKAVSRNKSKQSKYDKYGDPNYNNLEKYKETCQIKYNTDNTLKVPEIKARRNATNLKNLGVEYPLQNEEIYKKTLKNNKTHITETKIFNLIKEIYPDVIREYKSDKYPWFCDFYIPSLDLYIEFQGHWSHGLKPYNPNDPNDKLQLEKWIECEYKKSIKIWTVIDPLKRETAKKNNITLLEFFTMREFNEWYAKQKP